MWMISKSVSGSALKAVSVAFVPSKSVFTPNSCFYPLDNPRTYAYNKGWFAKVPWCAPEGQGFNCPAAKHAPTIFNAICR